MEATMHDSSAFDREPITETQPLADAHKGRELERARLKYESARRLANLGGSEPQLRPIPRRRI
jgi:hypothetical protein